GDKDEPTVGRPRCKELAEASDDRIAAQLAHQIVNQRAERKQVTVGIDHGMPELAANLCTSGMGVKAAMHARSVPRSRGDDASRPSPFPSARRVTLSARTDRGSRVLTALGVPDTVPSYRVAAAWTVQEGPIV